MDIITGNRFMDMCDIVYGHNIGYGFSKNIKAHNIPLIFCETHKLKEFFKLNISGKYVLISHNSDGGIVSENPREFDFRFVENKIPKKIVAWYAQNLDVISDRIHPIPIGLENWAWHQGTKWTELTAIVSQKIPKQTEKLVYLNVAPSTNPLERGNCINSLSGKEWVTFESKLSYLEYISNMAKHYFVACPEGNGLDTHRTWEALYLGCVPIVKRRIFTERLTKYFPLLLIDSWDEVTKERLSKFSPTFEIHAMMTKYLKKHLNFDFWKNKIIENL